MWEYTQLGEKCSFGNLQQFWGVYAGLDSPGSLLFQMLLTEAVLSIMGVTLDYNNWRQSLEMKKAVKFINIL